MTGAAVPRGADAVVMIEHVCIAGQTRDARARRRSAAIILCRAAAKRAPGRNCCAPGRGWAMRRWRSRRKWGGTASRCSRGRGSPFFPRATKWWTSRATPGPLQIRNSNGIALETLARTGGRRADLSSETRPTKRPSCGGASSAAWKRTSWCSPAACPWASTIWWSVLADLGAEFFFDAVAIRPGRPAVFGDCRGKLVFGLPGNPVSTMVTFELFVLPAVDMLGGAAPRPLPLLRARLAHAVHERGATDAFRAGAGERAAQAGSRRLRRCPGRVPAISWRWRGRMLSWWCRRKSSTGRQGNGRWCFRGAGRAEKWYRGIRCEGQAEVQIGKEEADAFRQRRGGGHGGRHRKAVTSAGGDGARIRAHGRAALAQVRRRKTPKGDPLEIARIAGIAAAKRTAEWIPLCHPLPLTHIDVTARLCKNGVEIASRVTATAQTGVEMEALVAVSAAALTVYDMCKALDKAMEITDIYLLEKTGGKSGHYRRAAALARLRQGASLVDRPSKSQSKPDCTNELAAKSVRVLVVDDNPLVRDLMGRGLEPLCDVTSPPTAPTRC